MTDLPRPEYWTTLDHLAVDVRQAADAVRKDREINEARIAASVQKMRWFRRAALLAVAASGLALWSTARANTAVNDIRKQRQETLVASCRLANTNASKTNRLVDADEQTLRDFLKDPRAQPLLVRKIADYEATKIALRDCSPAGIRAFVTKP